MATKKGNFSLTELLSNSSMQAVDSPAADAGRDESTRRPPLKVVPIKIADLIPSGDNFYSIEKIAELKASIEMFGVVQPLVVKPLTAGKYEIISGHRRHRACVELAAEGKREFEYIPCGIQGEVVRDPLKDRVLLIMTNSTIRELSDFEKMKQAEELTKHLTALKKRDKLTGRVRDLVAEILNTSTTNIARLNSISNNLAPELAAEFKTGRLGVSAAYELSGLSEDKQREAAAELQEKGGLSISDVKKKKQKAVLPPDLQNRLHEPKEYPAAPPDFEEGQDGERTAPEARDFVDLSAAEKAEAAIAFLNSKRFTLFHPGDDTRVLDFIIDTLESIA